MQVEQELESCDFQNIRGKKPKKPTLEIIFLITVISQV